MTQESRLVIVIDSKNAERNAKALAEEMSKITESGDSASQSSKNMGKQFSVTNNIVQNFNTNVNNANSTVQKSVEVTKQATQQNQKFSQEIKNTSQEFEKQEKAIDSYGNSIKSLAVFMLGMVAVSDAVSRADGFTQMAARIRNATDSAEEYDLVQGRLFESTKSTYRALNEAQEVYLGLAGGMKALGYQTKDTLDVSDSLSFSFVANAARADQAQSAIDAFSKSMAKGKIDADAWISIVSAADNVIADMAKTTGKSEVEIRQLGATGKISLEDLIKTLKATRDSNKDLADAMENSLADGLTTLSNAVTKYVGEMNMAMGVTNNAAGVLGVFAENIDIVMNAAMAGGLAYLTKTIIAKTIATDSGMISTLANRQASITNAQAQLAEATATVNAAKAHLANVQATNAATQAKYGATAAATRYAQAQAAVTAATNAQTAAQGRLAATSMSVGKLASGAFALIGGPIGAITLGVAGLTAAYSYFKNKADEANKILAEQAEVANRTTEELKSLQGAAKTKAIDDLTTAFKAQSDELKKTEQGVGSALIEIQNYAQGNVEVTRISNQARLGTISYKEAVEQLAAVKLPPTLRDALKEQIDKYNEAYEVADKTKTAVKLFGIEVQLTGNKAQNAAIEQQKHTNAINETKKAADEAVQSLRKMYDDKLWDVQFIESLMKKGFSESKANDLLKLYKESISKGLKEIDKEALNTQVKTWKAEDSIKSITDKRTESLRQQNKELKQQESLTKRLVGVSGNSGIGTGAHLDVRYGGSMSGQKVSNEHLARLKAADKPLSSYKVSSDYGPRKAPTKGASSFHKGIDFAMPVGTPITTNVAVKDVKTAYDPKGGGYYSTVTFEDGVVLKLLHQSPSMQSKVKGGSSNGSDKAGVDIQSQLDRQLDAQRSLENEVANEVQRIKNNLTVRLEDVDKAGFTPERSTEIKAELQRRADNDIAIAQQALRTKLDDYKDFQKTEEQLLNESFARKKFNATHDIELSKAELKQTVELLEQQYQQELGLLKLAQEQRLFQAKLALLSETEAMQERYRLEREEIQKNTKLSNDERKKMMMFSKAAQEQEIRDKIIGVVQNWGGIQADMNGTSDFYQQSQERFSRLGAAQDLFDSKSAAVDYNEQGGLDAIKAQMDQQLISQQAFEDQKTAIMQAAQEQRKIIADEYAQNAKAIEDQYQQDRLNTQILLGQQMMGSVTSMFGSMFGEQSKAYKVMFAADKAYAIAASGIAIQQGISKAMALGWPANIGVMAQVIAQGASIIGNIRAIKDQGFADGGYTGPGRKYDVAGSVHKGEIVWSQEDIKRWGGVNLVERMRKSANPENFLKGSNNASDDVMGRALMSSNAFMESQKKSNIFNQSGDDKILYKANQTVDTPKISIGSDLYHDGKVYFSPNGLVQDRSNLEDVYDFTMGRSARPQAEAIASTQSSTPTINFKIEVVNQVKGVAVEAEQLDENTVRLIVKDELDRTLPREVPKIVSDQIKDPSTPISRAISTNTTARRNR